MSPVTQTSRGTVLDPEVGELVRFEIIEGEGLEICSIEAERRLLPIVGPTVFALARVVIHRLDDLGGEPEWFEVATAAQWLGVPEPKIHQALKRAQRFGVARLDRGTWTFNRRWQQRPGRSAA